MKASDIKISEIFNQEPGTQFPMFGGQRLLISGMDAKKNLVNRLRAFFGKDQSIDLLTRYGYEIGMASAIGISSNYEFDSPKEWLKSAQFLGRITGLGALDIQIHTFNKEKGQLNFTVTSEASFEIECYLSYEKKLLEEPVCHIATASLSGFASVVFGKEILVKEIACQAMGHQKCIYEGRSAAEWGLSQEQIKEYWTSLELNSFEKEIDILKKKLQNARDELAAQNEKISRLELSDSAVHQESGMIYRSRKMQQVILLADKVAPTNSTVLINGESGTGKEVMARYIHNHSGRSDHPFRAVNCAALPPKLLESELFGHKKGAFTGADSDHKGLILEAGKGTFFLDEIGEMPLELQSKLLRVLQEKEVRPVGGLKSIPVNSRIIAATNQDLKSMVAEKKFREDLFYRLAVFPLAIEPLRNRKEDILLLSRHFLEKNKPGHPGFSPAALRLLENHHWPGNVRELENCIEYAVIMSGEDKIDVDHFPQTILSGDPLTEILSDLPPLKDFEKRYIEIVLKSTGGNKSSAAEILGISVTTLWRRLKEMGLS